jgi:hypothetical protein
MYVKAARKMLVKLTPVPRTYEKRQRFVRSVIAVVVTGILLYFVVVLKAVIEGFSQRTLSVPGFHWVPANQGQNFCCCCC